MQKPRPGRRAQRVAGATAGLLLSLLLALALAACNSFSLFYQNLDRYVAWRVERYVNLRPEQQRQLQQEFARLWQWHRQHLLPVYARELRQVAGALQAPLPAEEITAYLQRAQQHWEMLARQALPATCSLLRSLDQRQVDELLARLDRDNLRYFRRHVAPESDERRLALAGRQQASIERWLGPLSDPQEALLRRWARERDDLAPAWLDFRRQWRHRFGEALAQRQAPQACALLEPLLVRPLTLMEPELDLRSELNRRRWVRLLASLLAGMSPQQVNHVQRRLYDTATQLEQLVRTSA